MRLIDLRFLVPLIIFLSFLADAALRFVPPEHVAFRAWEAVGLLPLADGPCTPSMIYHNDRSYGDLPNLGNVPAQRLYRKEDFTTDEYGFRNTPTAENLPLRMITVGDSFIAGCAAPSDSETLGGQLAELSHVGVYNAGGNGANNWRCIEKQIKRLAFHGGLVIWELSNAGEQLLIFGNDTRSEVRFFNWLVPKSSPLYDRLRYALRVARNLALYSPLRSLATRAFRSIQDDRWLPNVSAHNVLWKRLRNGHEMGFLGEEMENDKACPPCPEIFVQLQAALKKTGNELFVVVLPNKYAVYYPLFMDPHDCKEPTASALPQSLRAHGIPALDLTAVFRQQATAALQHDQYIYWTDDTHWNTTGVRIAAQEILKTWREYKGLKTGI
jgi:hypothetical protein